MYDCTLPWTFTLSKSSRAFRNVASTFFAATNHVWIYQNLFRITV
jgi:hypothetical protein